MPLYNRLKKFRAKAGYNQQEMGRLIGVSRQTISLIERGELSEDKHVYIKFRFKELDDLLIQANS